MGDWDLYFLAGVESHASAGSEDRRGQQRDESNTRYRDRHISSRLYGGDRGGLSTRLVYGSPLARCSGFQNTSRAQRGDDAVTYVTDFHCAHTMRAHSRRAKEKTRLSIRTGHWGLGTLTLGATASLYTNHTRVGLVHHCNLKRCTVSYKYGLRAARPYNLLERWKWTLRHSLLTGSRFQTRVSSPVLILSPCWTTLTYTMRAWSGPSIRTCGEHTVLSFGVGAMGWCVLARSKKYLWKGRPTMMLPFVSGSMHVNVGSTICEYAV